MKLGIYRITIIFCLLFVSGSVISQDSKSISPYSRYGVGELFTPLFVPQLSMGELGAPYADFYDINIFNPATYSSLATPVFDVGLQGNFTRYTSSSGSESNDVYSMRNMALGFPMGKRFGGSFGVVPFSAVGYDVTQVEDLADQGMANVTFMGSGGLSTAYAGLAYDVIEKPDTCVLSFGVNSNLIFGREEYGRFVEFDPSLGYLNTASLDFINVGDWTFDLALFYAGFYKLDVKEGKRDKIVRRKWTLGFVYNTGNTLKGVMGQTVFSYVNPINSANIIDTISITDDENIWIKVPTKYAIGASAYLSDAWMLGVDFKVQNWSQAGIRAANEVLQSYNLKNSFSFSLGTSYYAGNKSYSGLPSYWNKMIYRAGFKYEMLPYFLNNTQLDQYSVSIGLGLPVNMKRSYSKINFGMEFGQRGTQLSGLIQEDFMNVFIGLSITPNKWDIWLKPRKID